jgi:hypothetical protein
MMLKKLRLRWTRLSFAPWSVLAVLFGLGVLAYGLMAPLMGFYWDDWPWIWLYKLDGLRGLAQIDQQFRPLAGEILALSGLLAGTRPLGWQALNLLFRWASAAAFWWMLVQIWPRHMRRAAAAAFLVLVYPGFTQQFIAVNSSRHILPLVFFCLSIGFMAWSLRDRRRFAWLTAASIGTAMLAFFSTDYYYGLELIRPLVIWIVLLRRPEPPRQRLERTLVGWTPYLLLLLAVFAWRFIISQQVQYPVTIFSDFASAPLETAIQTARTIGMGMLDGGGRAWARLFEFPATSQFGDRKTILFWLVSLASAGLVFLYLERLRDSTSQDRSGLEVAGLGLAALLLGGIPFLVTEVPVSLQFPSDRTTLALMAGACLLLVGLVDWLARPRLLKLAIFAAVIGLSVGAQFRAAAAYQRDWAYQVNFLRQLSWRAPGIQPGTALYILDLPVSNSTDNSLTAAVNWVYASPVVQNDIALMIFDLSQRLAGRLPGLLPGQAIDTKYGEFDFRGISDEALVVYYAPPACLRVLHPIYDAHFPKLPDLMQDALPLTALERIQADPQQPARLPAEISAGDNRRGWCYYLQKADLARQQADWKSVAELGDTAFALDDKPNHASERAPFIQGYAYTGQWERAVELTREALEINRFMQPMLCDLWADIEENAPDTPGKGQAVGDIRVQLACSIEANQ